MKLCKEEMTYDDEDGSSHILRIFYPSLPYGCWPGTDRTIHEWKSATKGQRLYQCPSQDEIIRLERLIQKINQLQFLTHPTLGLVCFDPTQPCP
jgi:hypothetical protein